eukprot:TRINITY_DN4637_c4_g1_i1.p1 TRINITY_DN4637_c4_g1~~TRINITY_DN4637_c4_g1_i1.p1  ORF type:complete len:347 (+),score=159.07 TRINITY_DN4637_c4_g1_i1:63-1103(+)
MATLGHLFDEAVALYTAADESELESANPQRQEMVQKSVEKVQELWQAVQSSGVFSTNEDRDDIATSDIKFFLVPYYFGDLQDKIVDTHRCLNLRRAIHSFECFMRICMDYEILSEREHEELTAPLNPTDRTARIERLKRQKELQARLAELSEKRKHLSRRIQSKQEAAEHCDDTAPEVAELESTSRRYWFLCVQDRLRAAAQQMHMAKRELEMLRSLTADEKQEAADEYQLGIERSRGKPPPEGAIRKIEHTDAPQVFSAFPNVREKILSEVFIDRNPPTMSEAEYAAIQMERMLPSDPPPPAEGEEKCSDDDDDEEAERKRKKASNWDDWKDDHARDGNMGANIG